MNEWAIRARRRCRRVWTDPASKTYSKHLEQQQHLQLLLPRRKPRIGGSVELWACAAVGLTLRTRRAAVHERDLGSAHEGIEHVGQRADDLAFPLVVLLADHACRGGTVLRAREAVVPDAEALDCTHAEWTRRSARHSADVSDSGRRPHGIPTADRGMAATLWIGNGTVG